MRPVRILAFAGRHATAFMAVGVLLGLVVPPLATLARPLLVPTLLIPLALALVRLDWAAAADWRRRPGVVVALLAWILVASPILVWLATRALATVGFPPPLSQALVLMAASSPIVSNVALALLLRLDAPLAVVVVLSGTALVPLTLPIAAESLVGVSLEIPLGEFMGRLGSLVGAAFAGAWLIRRAVPARTLDANRDLIDGLTVLNLLLFGLAIMDGVAAYALARPGYVAVAIVAAFAFNLALQAAGYAAFRRLGPSRALTVALLTGNCNMGLVLVALEGRASFDVVVYFALAQIPMYTLPALLKPLYARLAGAPGGAR
jgi:BASS family bile acid:Na+ symporter